MAYLKGGSVVDGNLYVEGGLVVRNIATSAGGQLPTLDTDSSLSDHLVKFINNQGALFYTQLGESVDKEYIFTDKSSFAFNLDGNGTESKEAIKIEKDNNNHIVFTLNTCPRYINIEENVKIYDEESREIEEDFISRIQPDDLDTSGVKINIPKSFS